MKRNIIALSIAAAFATTSFASVDADMAAQLEMLKKQIAALEAKLNTNTQTITNNSKLVKKNTKKIKKTSKKLNVVKAHDAGDNIKWDIDFRTAVDKITYKHADGTKSTNDALLTNRLILGLKYQPEDNMVFYGALSYNKAYGDSSNHSQSNTNPAYANFDWVTNENATDNSLKVKEAYWLYMNDTFLGANMPWTASVGRRPSTDGLGSNFREGIKAKSAIASTVNMEFDGASFKWNLDQVIPLTGSWVKICMGRGITNAKQRFSPDWSGADYATDEALHADSNMLGLIFVPYDDGQYSLYTNYAKANNLIGFTNMEMGAIMAGGDGTFQDVGDFTIMTAMVKADGIGEEINDFLDNTTVFASYSRSKTSPNSNSSAVINPLTGMTNGGMLGSTDSKTGTSVLIGIQMPCLFTDDGRIGFEWNKGSKYWRSMTYGEDTMIGSKIAARGTAIEAYWLKPLTKSLSLSIRHTQIDYDYTGSNAFFGADGTPMTMKEAQSMGQNPVEKASDTRIAISYKY